jgi:hypothetical protein
MLRRASVIIIISLLVPWLLCAIYFHNEIKPKKKRRRQWRKKKFLLIFVFSKSFYARAIYFAANFNKVNQAAGLSGWLFFSIFLFQSGSGEGILTRH